MIEKEIPIYEPEPASANVKSTVRGGRVEVAYVDDPTQINSENTTNNRPEETPQENDTCIKCGYPLMATAQECPNCGYSSSPAKPKEATPPASNNQEKPQPKKANFNATVDIYNIVEINSCKLTPIPKNGEQTVLPALEFTETTILNRGNTEPNNNTITSREQAELAFVDGIWYIKDCSDLKSTFIRREGPIQLQTGDIINMGDRKFEVDIDQIMNEYEIQIGRAHV